jgi:hypothetical protein
MALQGIVWVDEKSFLKRHQYVSIVVDLDHPHVLHCRGQKAPASYRNYGVSGWRLISAG